MELKKEDYLNILGLFKRPIPLSGLDEAQALVLLAHKVQEKVASFDKPSEDAQDSEGK